jgi:hypothetical protein
MHKTIDLQQFCGYVTEIRTHLQQPQQHSGWLIATNGHICVRVPDPTATQPSKLAHCTSVINMFEAAHKVMRPLPDFQACQACASCNGKSQYKQTKCNVCEGEGSFMHYRQDYDCKSCDGDGWHRDENSGTTRSCQTCYGHGVASRKTAIYGASFDVAYLAKIKTLPGIQIAVAERQADTFPAMYFKFDGGEGLLMPMLD